jgi:anti-repressor protein
MPQIQHDHQLTIPMAKEICMLQRTEKGKECRQYFIKVEEAWNTPEMIVARAHQILQARLDEAISRVSLLESKIEEDAPATNLGYAVTAADDSILIGVMAKILRQNGYDTGEQRFFETLRREGFLIKSGSDRNMPTQRALEMGLFTIKENVHVTPNGSFTTRTTLVTGKGQNYFVNRYCGKGK